MFEALQHVHDLAVEHRMGWYKCRTYQGCFGAEVEKPTNLWSSTPWVLGLKKQRPPPHTFSEGNSKIIDNYGHGVKGRPANLRQTAEYPKLFAEAIVQNWITRDREDWEIIGDRDEEADKYRQAATCWDAANLNEVWDFISG